MKRDRFLRSAAAWIFVAALSQIAGAQQAHPIDVGGAFTYTRTNILPGCNCFSTEGGSAQAEIGLTHHLFALGDVTVTHAGDLAAGHYDLTQSTFTAGLRGMPFAAHRRLQPFGDVLVGGAHASGSLSPQRTGFGGGATFAFETGGGVQVPLSRRLTLMPVEVHYLLTTFGNGAANRQNDLRVTTGVLFRIRR